MQNFRFVFIFAVAVLIQGCKTRQPATLKNQAVNDKQNFPTEIPDYRSSVTMLNDLVHTSLSASFNWPKRYMNGKVEITLHPHFYPTNTLLLNARGMQINEVSMVKPTGKTGLAYHYENDSLLITLDRKYKKEEEYKIFIDYIAKPEELKEIGGSAAITSDKGLYFINPDGKEKFKPRQIWTQGETQSNSVWLPTIDAPNQKMTQDIAITVESSMITLSNGLQVKTELNPDGTRTDYWKQSLPHAPYLAMMAIGNFASVRDYWRSKEVNYYIDPDYENDARMIFGKTPEMMEFFSNKLQVPFAWEKYAQVVAHDYVSGSMENTSATLHGEFIEEHSRELLDQDFEDFISHELFHQWFGDLVTCESWSNLPLNESFATYGEYLWREYKYGREEADNIFQRDLASYLRVAKSKPVNLIRFSYVKQEDMFDRISYQKGGCILHMLRKYVGDEAFFASLKLYLERNKFKAVEFHNLRLAFEETTGEDLNWFFNQWFLNSGNPDLDIAYEWDPASKSQMVTVKQMQNQEKTSLFKLPVDIDFYINEKTERRRIVIDKQTQSFSFPFASQPDFVNTDAEKMLVCTKNDHHSEKEWIYLYKNGKLYADRKEALVYLAGMSETDKDASAVFISALGDPFWDIREYALNNIRYHLPADHKDEVKSKINSIIQKDSLAVVRITALKTLLKCFPDDDHETVLRMAMNDSSYTLSGNALFEFTKKNKVEGMKIARSREDLTINTLRENIFALYAEYGDDKQADFMHDAMLRSTGFDRYNAVDQYSRFLKHCTDKQVISKGLSTINEQATNDTYWQTRLAAALALKSLGSYFKDKSTDDPLFAPLKTEVDDYIEKIKQNDKDDRLKHM